MDRQPALSRRVRRLVSQDLVSLSEMPVPRIDTRKFSPSTGRLLLWLEKMQINAPTPSQTLLAVRVQTWAPYTIQIYSNGGEWMCRQLAQQGVEFTRSDNKILCLSDLDASAKLSEKFKHIDWPGALIQKYSWSTRSWTTWPRRALVAIRWASIKPSLPLLRARRRWFIWGATCAVMAIVRQRILPVITHPRGSDSARLCAAKVERGFRTH